MIKHKLLLMAGSTYIAADGRLMVTNVDIDAELLGINSEIAKVKLTYGDGRTVEAEASKFNLVVAIDEQV